MNTVSPQKPLQKAVMDRSRAASQQSVHSLVRPEDSSASHAVIALCSAEFDALTMKYKKSVIDPTIVRTTQALNTILLIPVVRCGRTVIINYSCSVLAFESEPVQKDSGMAERVTVRESKKITNSQRNSITEHASADC